MPVKSRIRTIPHYPRHGIQFRDITTLLQDPVGFRIAIDELAARYAGHRIDKVVGIELRGQVLECAFLVDLPELGGRVRLEQQGRKVFALCAFEGH